MGSIHCVPERKEPYRVGTSTCLIDEPYVYNHDFVVLVGKEFFSGGNLVFPKTEEKPDGTYRTKFGPGVAHSGQIFANNNTNMGYAMRRLTGARLSDQEKVDLKSGKPCEMQYHKELFRCQREFFASKIQFFSQIAALYAPFFESFVDSEVECTKHYADIHPKRLLRMQAHQELVESGQLYSPKDPWVKSVLWKLKKDEWAKPGKKPRMIGDLGVGASLRGFVLMNCLKLAQDSVVVDYLGGQIQFCKSPDPFALKSAFDKLINPPGRFFFLYFSDDSCFSIRVRGVVYRYNLDISSCDASHGPAVFDMLEHIIPARLRTDIKLLVKQCQIPLRVESRTYDKSTLILRPKRPMLYSGSTITTAINNLANLAIAICLAEMDFTCDADIEVAAKRCGYIVTGCSRLEMIEDIQFLKHSPVLAADGEYHPMLNLGVLMRASGTCKGDLPGRGELTTRARMFQRGLLRGAYPYTTFQGLTLMKQAIGQGEWFVNKEIMEKVVDIEYPPYVAVDDSIYDRYRLTPLERAEFVMDYARMDVFHEYSGTLVSKVLEKDYGLSSKSTLEQSW
jgi:hypothetical protein